MIGKFRWVVFIAVILMGLLGGIGYCSESEDVEVKLFTIRRNFLRMEEDAFIGVKVLNKSGEVLSGAELRLEAEGVVSDSLSLPDIAAGGTYEVESGIDTNLRPGRYELKVWVEREGERRGSSKESLIIANRLQDRMPVVMWGVYGPREGVIDRLREFGFTNHLLRGERLVSPALVWEEGKDVGGIGAPGLRMVDKALGKDYRISLYLSTARYAMEDGKFNRINREGDPRDRYNVCGLFDEVREFCYNYGALMAQGFEVLGCVQTIFLIS